MKFTTLVPTRRNDGSPVEDAEMRDILRGLRETFGGVTLEGTTEGQWTDDGTVYLDECWKVSVVTENDRYSEAEQAVRDIGKRLGQLAMFFEVQYFDGVRFLRTDD